MSEQKRNIRLSLAVTYDEKKKIEQLQKWEGIWVLNDLAIRILMDRHAEWAKKMMGGESE